MCIRYIDFYCCRSLQLDVVEGFIKQKVIILTHVAINNRPMDCVQMGEPCSVNPNSYDRVRQVLAHIQGQGSRAWSAIGSDGVPYVLAHRSPELQNILLLPGPGHIEINVLRALFKLMWPLGLEDLAKLLGFRTHKALTYALKVSDFHKSWQVHFLKLCHATLGSDTRGQQSLQRTSPNCT